MTEILLVRHAQASFGGPDYDLLSERGKAQARLLGEWLGRDGRGPGVLVTGSLRRHRETAAALCAALPPALRPAGTAENPGLDEFDFIDVLRRHRPELEDLAAIGRFLAASSDPARDFRRVFTQAVTAWMAAPDDGPYREGWGAFGRRCRAAFARCTEAAGPAAGRVCVVTSGGPIAAIVQGLLGLDDARTLDLNFALFNAGLTRVRASGGRMGLVTFNTIGHLERTGDQEMITRR